MRSWLMLFAVLVVGCQTRSADPPPPQAAAETETEAAPSNQDPIDPAYLADFENLCHSEERSGADDQPGQRSVHIAMWLGEVIKTQEARTFLATLSRTAPDQKAALLDAERQRLGMGRCPLIAAWKQG